MEERRLLHMQEDKQYDEDVKLHRAQLMEVALGERDEADVVQLKSNTLSDEPIISDEMKAAMMGFNPGVITGPQPVPVPGGKRGPWFNDESKKGRKLQQKAGGYNPQSTFERNRDEAWLGIFIH